jgi:hypothetical protein
MSFTLDGVISDLYILHVGETGPCSVQGRVKKNENYNVWPVNNLYPLLKGKGCHREKKENYMVHT